MRGLFGGRALVRPFSEQDPTDAAARMKPPPVFSQPYSTAAPGSPTAKPMQQPARRGLFGRIGAYLTPERLSLIAAALADGGAGFADEQERQRSARDSIAYQAMRMRAGKYDIADAEQRRQESERLQGARERYGARLTPEQQDEFALDPEGTMERARGPEYSEFGPIGGGFYGQRNTRTGEYGNIAASPFARGGRAASDALSAQDQIRLREASDAGNTARTIQQQMERFSALNREEPTGELSSLIPTNIIPGMAGAARSEMRGITDRLVPMLNAAVRLPGAASERDAARLTSAAPNVGRTGNANEAIIRGYRQATQNAIDYSQFSEQYALQAGTTIGVDTAWNRYLEANPIHDAYGNVRSDRPDFQTWMAIGQPDMSQAVAPGGVAQSLSDEDLLQEFNSLSGTSGVSANRAPLNRGTAVREGSTRMGYGGVRETYRNGRWVRGG